MPEPRHLVAQRPTLLLLSGIVATGACDTVVGEPDRAAVADWAVLGGLRIGDIDEPGYAFGTVGSIAVAPDGSIFTAHPRDLEVRRWTPDGKPDGRVGGEGQGPGEFRGLGALGFVDDTLWIVDMRNHRVTYYEPEGEVLRTVPIAVDSRGRQEDPTLGRPRPSHPLMDGTFYGRQSGVIPQMAGRDVTPVLHLRLDRHSSILDTIQVTEIRKRDVMAAPGVGRQWLYGYQPFADGALTGFEVGQEALVVVDRPAPSGRASARYSVVKVSATGDTLFRRDVSYELRPVEDEEVQRVVDQLTARWMAQPARGDMEKAELERLARDALFVPDYHPPVSRVVLGRDGSIWLRETLHEGTDTWWTVLDTEGQLLARVALPSAFVMHVAERDHVWGVSVDRAGVNYITRLDVGRGSRASGSDG